MFAKLTTKSGHFPSANVFYNTLMNVITGAITSNTQLSSDYFNLSASYIINTIPSGWTLNDPQANLVGTVPILPGANPVVLKADWTDSSQYAKYLWVAPTHFQNTVFNIVAVPAEGWANTTKTISNSYCQPAAVTANNTSFSRRDVDLISPMNNFHTGNGVTIIVSASQAHLFVASYKDIFATQFNNYFHLSEYTRDDPWNTVSKGYPSWFFDSAANTFAPTTPGGAGATAAAGVHQGALARILNTQTNVDMPWVPLLITNAGLSNWGITTRYIPYAFNGAQIAAGSIGGQGGLISFGGLCTIGQASNFTGNQYYGRDINENPARILAEMRITAVHNGANVNSNTIFAGGSINTVAPFIYVTNSGWASLDEVTINNETYLNLNIGTGTAGTTNCTSILIREA